LCVCSVAVATVREVVAGSVSPRGMFGETLKVSMALCCIWAWLVPHFYIEYMEYRLALIQSQRKKPTSTTAVEEGDESNNDSNNNNNDSCNCTIPTSWNGNTTVNPHHENDDDSQHDRLYRTMDDDDANKALLRGAAAAFLILVVIYTASAIGIALPTENIDRRADAIVIGFGRILSAVLFAIFSVEVPQWLGVTYSSQRGNYYKQQVSPSTTTSSLKELSFRVCWSILGHFFVMYCIMLLHFTSPTRWSIPLSTIVGVAFGFGVIWAVYVGRTTYKNHTALIAFVFSFVIMVSSAAAFSAGCWYIKEMWYEEDIGYQEEYTLITFFGWLSLCVIANVLCYRLTKRKLKAAATDGNSTIGAGSSAIDVEMNDVRSNWRYKSQVFQPPESVCFAATELSKATARVAVDTVRSPFIRAGSTLSRMRTRSSGSSLRPRTRHHDRTEGNDSSTCVSRPRAASADAGTTENLPRVTPNRVRTCTEPTVIATSSLSKNRGRCNSEYSCSSSASSGEIVPSGNHTELLIAASNRSPLARMETDLDSSLFDIPLNHSGSEDTTESNHALLFGSPEMHTSSVKGDMESCDVQDPTVKQCRADDDEKSIVNNELEPSLWFMIKTNSCCGKRQHYKAPPRKRWERVLNFVKWTLWGITSAMHIFFLIICIGATAQQERVRTALPGTFSLLYPNDIVESTMCAWNESSPNADIRTFDSLDAVLKANYTVIHCGACGSCSNWHDLSLQWTTRSKLAALGQEWYVPSTQDIGSIFESSKSFVACLTLLLH
jgi:hypothetical protein